MPLTNNRGESIRVFRPRGTKYGQAINPDLLAAMRQAMGSFVVEFGYAPKQEDTVWEINGVTGAWVADVLEVVNFDQKPRPKKGQP